MPASSSKSLWFWIGLCFSIGRSIERRFPLVGRCKIVGRKVFVCQSVCIGCPRIIRTCIFPQLSLLRWNRWRCGYQNFMVYSSKGKTKCHTLQKSPHDPVQPLFPVRAEKLLFPFYPSTKQAIIDKRRNPRFHNRAISIKFAGEPVNRVWNQLDISRTQIFQQLRCAKTKSGLIGKLGWNRKSRPFPDATKVLAIVAERCYQKTCKLTNNQT